MSSRIRNGVASSFSYSVTGFPWLGYDGRGGIQDPLL